MTECVECGEVIENSGPETECELCGDPVHEECLVDVYEPDRDVTHLACSDCKDQWESGASREDPPP